jgi:hypothetical protein
MKSGGFMKKEWQDLKKSTVKMVYAFASRVAMRYNMEFSHCLQKAEDIQWDSIKQFDESRGAKFSTFLYSNLRQMNGWAWHEKRLRLELSEEIYNQIPAPEDRHELDVPAHLQALSSAIVMGYGHYFDNGKLSDTKKSLKELSEYTGLPSNQIYLQLNELRNYLSRGAK